MNYQKKRIKRTFLLTIFFFTLSFISSNAYATELSYIYPYDSSLLASKNLTEISDADKELVLNELHLDPNNISADDYIALFTKGTTTVWNTSYSGYNLKKSLSMNATLSASNTSRPYTNITISNTGSYAITAIAYKGELLGSKTIITSTIAPGKTKTMQIKRSDILKYGTINSQGTVYYLPYNVSLYNLNGNKIACKVKAIRYD